MSRAVSFRIFRRRDLIKLGGGLAAAAAGARLLPDAGGRLIEAAARGAAAQSSFPSGRPGQNIHLGATDGWIFLPGSIPSIHPDPFAPPPRTTYMFGFRNVTGFSDQMVLNQKSNVQHSAPLWWIDEGTDNKVQLTDLGLAARPDLVDSHTIHFHGFRNAIPLFDGVPELSIAVPIGRDFTYFYRPREPGTYMYHCHFEDVEHVHMGMTGIVFVRPYQNTPGAPGNAGAGAKYVFNDAVDPTADPLYPNPNNLPAPGYKLTPQTAGVSRYDREFAVFLSEVMAQIHWNDAHLGINDWSEYNADFFLMNGRVYPDTILPSTPGYIVSSNFDTGPVGNGGFDPVTGDLKVPAAGQRLQYQPLSSLITCNSGDRVLLRFVNLGYTQAAMTLDGIPMRIVGKDATLLRGRDGTDLTYMTDVAYFGAGESYDAIFVAPTVTAPTTYLLYNRKLGQMAVQGTSGTVGQMTEVRVYPAGTLPAQKAPQDPADGSVV